MRALTQTIIRAKRLRGELSLPEVILWDCIRAGRLEGMRFRRQHPVGPYILDFYCAAAKLAVEVDGAHHDFRDQMAHDAKRDAWLAEKGIRVMRFAASDVLDENAIEGVLVAIATVASGEDIPTVYRTRFGEADDAPSVPSGHLPRFAGEDSRSRPSETPILPRLRGRWPEGTEGAQNISTSRLDPGERDRS